MKLSRETKIWVGTVIVLALILQVVTYVKYNKLESQVAGFHESLAVAQDETEAASAYNLFYDQTSPLLKAQEADAGWRWSYLWGRGWVWGRDNKPTPPPAGGYDDLNCYYGNTKPECATQSTGATGPGGRGSGASGSGTLCLPGSSLRECQGRGAEQN